MQNVPSNIGRYSIVEAIGHGGMGSLYLAWDAKLERQLAIKVLKEDNADLRERFAREAKSAARLRHPHIVTIFELGEHDGQPYIAMEYIHGRTLAQIIRAREDIPLGRMLELIAALCDGLAFAHKAGIIHRDVKPANIMVDDEGSLKILDFGIARLAESAGLTQAGMMVGTLNYMSPEQVIGQTADHRSDIFAVGLVFYELLTQTAAFPGTVSTGVLGKILHTEPRPLAEVCPGLDEDVIRIVGRAIEKDVNRRYQDLTEMRREILTVRRHVEVGEGLTRVRDTPAPHVPSSQSSAERRASERSDIAQRRATKIQHYLAEADRAIQEERYDSAIEACEHLLMLDAENARGLDLVDRARAAIEARHALQLLSQADRDLQAGSLTIAAQRIDQAGRLHPSTEQEELREEVEHAREARERARVSRQPHAAEAKPAEPVGQELRTAPARTPSRSLSRGWMIAAAAVVVILLAGGAYYRFGLSQSPAQTPPPTRAPQPGTVVAQPPPPAPEPSPPPIDPQVTRANELVSEGQRLLGESKLGQARASFQQAQTLAATQGALDGLAEIDRRQAEYARLWKEGRTAAARKRTTDALSRLDEARALDPERFQSDGGPALVDSLQAQSERDRALATAAAADTKRLEASRKASIALFNEGQKLEQQRQYDKADEKYQEAFAADKNNEEAAAAFARGERYRKAKAAGLAAVKANNRDGALRELGNARSIDSARFLAEGLDKAIGDNTRGRAAPPPAPTPSAPAPTPSAPKPASTADESAIAAVLGALAKALSTETNKSHDLKMVRQAWPGAGGDVFGDNESQTYIFSNLVFVSPPGDKASVDCLRTRQVRPRSASKTTVSYDPVRIELQKAKGTWQVMSIVQR